MVHLGKRISSHYQRATAFFAFLSEHNRPGAAFTSSTKLLRIQLPLAGWRIWKLASGSDEKLSPRYQAGAGVKVGDLHHSASE